MSAGDGKVTVTIELDLSTVGSWTDDYLAAAFAAVQLWKAPFGDGYAEHVAETLRWVIIRRWLEAHGGAGLEQYHHQADHSRGQALRELGAKYEPAGPTGSPDWYRGTWKIPTQEKEQEA